MNDIFDIPEDITTEEQLRRCRELLASNLCSQGVRAVPEESLPQLIAKVSKIDRQQRHINALKNYAATLKQFAKDKAQDFAIAYYSSVIYATSSQSTANGNNMPYATAGMLIPTSFTVDGVTYSVARTNVVLVSGQIYMPWGNNASSSYDHFFYPSLHDNSLSARTFDQLKARASYVTPGGRGTTMSTIYYYNASTSRSSNDYYTFTSYPYSTSYDYWHGNTTASLRYSIWAFKLPALTNNDFPVEPEIPTQEFYY